MLKHIFIAISFVLLLGGCTTDQKIKARYNLAKQQCMNDFPGQSHGYNKCVEKIDEIHRNN